MFRSLISRVLNAYSHTSRKFCGVFLRTSNIGHPFGFAKCHNWVRQSRCPFRDTLLT